MANKFILEAVLTAKNKAEAEIKKFNSGISKIKDASKSLDDRLKSAEDASRKFAIGLAGAATAVAGMSVKFAQASGELQSMKQSFERMSNGIVDDSDKFRDAVSEATAGTVKSFDIFKNANRAMALIGTESFKDMETGTIEFQDKFAQMAEYSTKASLAMGESVDYMFDSIVRGVGRASPLILDNLGISVKAGEVYDAYAASIGKTAEQLTAQEQKTALLNESLTQLQAKYGDVTLSSDNVIIAQQQLGVAWAEFMANEGAQLTQWYTDFIALGIRLIEEVLPRFIEKIQEIVKWFQEHESATKILAGAIIGALIPVVAGLVTSFIVLAGAMAPFILGGAVIVGFVLAINELIMHWEDMKGKIISAWDNISVKTRTAIAMITGAAGFGGIVYGIEIMISALKTFEGVIDRVMSKAREAVIRVKEAISGATGLKLGGGGASGNFASGGVVTSPTRALIGEGGPEAVIPLNKVGGAKNALAASGVGGGGITVNMNGLVPFTPGQRLEVGRMILEEIKRAAEAQNTTIEGYIAKTA